MTATEATGERPSTGALPAEPEAGFTLVEMLVALTLLGVLMVAVLAGLRFGLRAWERGEVHTAGTDAVRLTQELLRRDLGRAYPLLVTADPTDVHIDFEGGAEAVRFLAPAPTALQEGGNARYTVRTVRHGGSLDLVLAVQSELAWNGPIDRQSGSEDVLLTGLSRATFAYFGADRPDQPPTWRDHWSGQTRLPRLIRLQASFQATDTRTWPDLVIAPRLSVDVACVYDPLTRYCQGR